MNRREMLKGFTTAMAVFPHMSANIEQGQTATPSSAASVVSVKALVFDVFGTVVDWRSSIITEGPALARGKDINIDWALFADRWRAAYSPSMDRVRKGELPWTKLDDLHRMSLDALLKEFKIDGLSEEEKDHWNKVWHRLKPWPDSVAGLTRLKKKYIIAPLSNGNIALMTDMAKRSGLPWDVILGAELARHYKPDPEVYRSAGEFLGLKSQDVMMVAAHVGDLRAARNQGLRTGFIYRPNEYGRTRAADKASPGDFDVVANDMIDLAVRLGA